MTLRDVLHDEIDNVEGYREETAEIIEKAKAKVLPLASEAESFEELLNTIAFVVGEDLADLTTKAVRESFELGKKRVV